MAKEFQHITRSQFVLTYGPGSIIETKNGPRLIPALARGLGKYFNEQNFERFEINDVRLSKYVQKRAGEDNRARILALPSNAGLEKIQNSRVYSTQIFPVWKICYGRKEGKKHKPILYSGYKCPLCKTDEDSGAVRFVAACPAGHLDEVNWHYALHGNGKCRPQYYYWNASGSSLANIEIKCPDCSARKTMQEIYNTPFYCTGRYPEKERSCSDHSPYYSEQKRTKNCDQNMRITQRQSTSLRIPDTVTLLTIPKYDNQLTRVLQRNSVSVALNAIFGLPEEVLSNMNDDLLATSIVSSVSGIISSESLDTIKDTIEEKGINWFTSFYRQMNDGDNSFLDLMYEEFESLLIGAGIHKENFIMDECEFFSQIPNSFIPSLKVYPVKKIRTVTVQTGYRRMVSGADIEESTSVPTSAHLNGSYWYPGFEGFGEGVFITFADDGIPDLSGTDAYDDWIKYKLSGYTGNSEWTDICAKPEFVWIHTLSHALIKAISGFTGYSSASLRERVYLSRDGTNGGILIYNTSPGEDGGMGGLSGCVKDFPEIMQKAEDIIRICSNDPLCNDIKKSPESVNGATCYSCLLLSETSCEHRNLWLDRHLLIR